MPKHSAGILLYKLHNNNFEVFLVHPGGPFWAKKDVGAWSLPKGEYEPGDDPWLAAQREFREETGQAAPKGAPIALGEVKYNNKILIAWAVAGDMAADGVKSNTFTIEWPPRSGKQQTFPEVDRAAWYLAVMAKEKLVGGQVAFIDRLASYLGVEIPTTLPETTQTSLL